MTGRIKVGLWLPFSARQECDGCSFAWRARASKTLGSTAAGGGVALDLFVCYRSTLVGMPINPIGIGIGNLTAPQNGRNLYTLSADFTPGVGTFNVGLCGSTTNPTSWNSNDNGYVTATLHK